MAATGPGLVHCLGVGGRRGLEGVFERAASQAAAAPLAGRAPRVVLLFPVRRSGAAHARAAHHSPRHQGG